ncbi:MAG: Phenylacetate-CoA ligase, partial [Methanomicrobiales archaeon 53_19]
GAEPWSEGMRRHIEEDLGVKAYDIYGTSELSGPMFTECEERDGIHIWGDMAIVEIIDPETEEVLPPGEVGELVMTVLRKEALPMVRYRVKDLTYLIDDECSCGRTSVRIGRISGRSDDMLIVRGINVFPSQVEHTLMNIPEVGEQFMIILDRRGALDTMTVQVELSPEYFSDKMSDMIAIKNKVSSELKRYLNVSVDVELMDPGSLPRFEGKAKRVIDRREF